MICKKINRDEDGYGKDAQRFNTLIAHAFQFYFIFFLLDLINNFELAVNITF